MVKTQECENGQNASKVRLQLITTTKDINMDNNKQGFSDKVFWDLGIQGARDLGIQEFKQHQKKKQLA